MDPFGMMHDPFGMSGMPGDQMEQVLSLQSYDESVDGEVAAPCSITNACRTCGCITTSCDTTGCTFSCAIGPKTGFSEELSSGW